MTPATAHLTDADRQRLHADHREMPAAFVAGDAPALLSCAAAHHQRLLDAIATLPPGGDAFADEPSHAPSAIGSPGRSAPCTSS